MNSNLKGHLKKVFLVMIWIIISLGVYQCGVSLPDHSRDIEEETADGSQSPEPDYSEKLPFDKTVRILIMTQDFKGIYHSELKITCSEGMLVECGGKVSGYEPDSQYILDCNDLKADEHIVITGRNEGRLQIENIGRNSPAQYRGKLECYAQTDGIVVVNELSVEEYLYGVVPSEMPSSYPEEALKAQAICARTYTYFHKQNYAYPQWKANMDDSTAFQVYMNCAEDSRACQAVDDTKDQVLTYKDAIVQSFYYSTSGGMNGGAGVWKDKLTEEDAYLKETGNEIYAANNDEGEAAFKAYIDNGNPEDVEYDEAWYRWKYEKTLDTKAVKNILGRLYSMSLSQPQKVRIRSQYLSAEKLKEEDTIADIRILNRRKSGLVTAIMIDTEHFRVSVISQHTIRQALGCDGDTAIKKDGTSYAMGDILPSAYFYIQKGYDNNGESGDNLNQIIIYGAGLGHGCGMSQNGAKCLANRGLTAAEILAYYYNGSVKSVEELVTDNG